MARTSRLVTIPFSHFCEKARWGLDRARVTYVEERYLPFFHLLGTVARRRGRSTPVWIDEDGRVHADSTDILLALDPRLPEARRLHGASEAERADALALEERFDRVVGPAVRRIAYHHLSSEPARLAGLLQSADPGWQGRIASRAPRLVARGLDKALDLGATATARSLAALDTVLTEVDARTDGTRWLVGERFSVADLTLAALLSPLVAPPEHPIGYAPDDAVPAPLAALRARVRSSAAGALALRAYREERR